MKELLLELYFEEVSKKIFDIINNCTIGDIKNTFLKLLKNNEKENDLKIYLTPCRIVIAIKCDLKINNNEYEEKIATSFIEIVNTLNNLTKKTANFSFISHIQNILYIIDEKIISKKFWHLISSNSTFGNKILNGLDDKIEIKNLLDYEKLMLNHNVILSFENRKNIIIEKIVNIQKDLNYLVCENRKDRIINNIANSNEFLDGYCIKFNPLFLELPENIIQNVISNFYNGICLRNKNDHLLSNTFLIFLNIKTINNNLIINIENNLNERLTFIKTKLDEFNLESLDSLNKKLKKYYYFENFGNIYDKVERMTDLTRFLCFCTPHCDLNLIESATKLSKIDLVSALVQNDYIIKGYVAEYYAKFHKYSPIVCQALSEYYLPENANDFTPFTDIGKILSIADKIDDIIALIMMNKKYNGSSDFYGIKRRVSSIIKIIIEGKINVNIEVLVHKSISLFKTSFFKKNNFSKENIKQQIIDIERICISLFKERFIIFLKKDFNKNVISAMLFENDIYKKQQLKFYFIYNKIKFISSYKDTNKFNNIKETYKRLNNILVNFKIGEIKLLIKNFLINKTSIIDSNEQNIYKYIKKTKKMIRKETKNEHYSECLDLLFNFHDIVNDLFKQNIIQSDNSKQTNNMLFLLYNIKKIFDEFLNFSKLY